MTARRIVARRHSAQVPSIESRTIWLRSDAPPKPPAGQACNGCGVCCAAEPCPLGMLISRRRRGACRALDWDAAARRYRCTLLPPWPGARGPNAPRRPAPPWRERLLRRWIGAGRGCDSTATLARH